MPADTIVNLPVEGETVVETAEAERLISTSAQRL